MSDYLRYDVLIIGKKSINLPDCVWYYSLMQYFKNNSLHLSNNLYDLNFCICVMFKNCWNVVIEYVILIPLVKKFNMYRECKINWRSIGESTWSFITSNIGNTLVFYQASIKSKMEYLQTQTWTENDTFSSQEENCQTQ